MPTYVDKDLGEQDYVAVIRALAKALPPNVLLLLAREFTEMANTKTEVPNET